MEKVSNQDEDAHQVKISKYQKYYGTVILQVMYYDNYISTKKSTPYEQNKMEVSCKTTLDWAQRKSLFNYFNDQDEKYLKCVN